MRSAASQKKRRIFFTRKALAKKRALRYREVEPGVFIKTI